MFVHQIHAPLSLVCCPLYIHHLVVLVKDLNMAEDMRTLSLAVVSINQFHAAINLMIRKHAYNVTHFIVQ